MEDETSDNGTSSAASFAILHIIGRNTLSLSDPSPVANNSPPPMEYVIIENEFGAIIIKYNL